MALTLDISSGQVDVGDTKKLEVTPKDDAGTAIDVADLVVVFTSPAGTATTYAIGASGEETEIGSPVASVYTILHTFSTAGVWRVKVTATDAEDNVEVESGYVRVR